MPNVPDFSTLDNVFTQFTPTDLVGTVTPNLGGVGAIPGQPAVPDQDAFSLIRSLLENDGRGVYTATDLKNKLQQLTQKAPPGGFDPSAYLDFYSTQGFIDALGAFVKASKTYMGPDGSKQQVSSFQQIVGRDFTMPNGKEAFDTTVVLSRTPFFSPATRSTHRAEIFLNSMPNTVVAQLVPFLQVEFQLTRSPSPNLQAPGLLKFLLGAPAVSKGTDATDLLAQGRQLDVDQNRNQLDFSGMEMFTAPQTLVNPQPNLNNGVGTSGRYADVVDPFRPFASIENVTISIVPAGAGFYTYKKASLTIKVHDRSRLSELSDFIRPRVYTGVTVWLTYGWRAPDRPGVNPYFDYVNDNMLLREAYGIINSSFSFDNVGQVVLTLELFTKGVSEMRQSKISDVNGDLDKMFQDMQLVGEKIAEYRQALNLDPQSGLNKELRPYIVLDAAERGTYPSNIAGNKDIQNSISTLKDTLLHTKGIDKDAVSNLITELQKYYQMYSQLDPITGKMTLADKLQTRVTQTIQAMFTECTTGSDPFLLTSLKDIPDNVPYGQELAKVMDAFNKAPPTKTVLNVKKNTAVSFGKLFTVFAIRNLISAQTVDELQVFFYPLNEACGPCSSLSIAQFPIDMPMFLDQYREYVVRNGGERITLEDFLGLVINAQFLDPRAIGYGMRGAYAPFDPKDPSAKKSDKQGDQDSFLNAWGKQYGTFKQPTIEMMIEVTHKRASDTGENDVLLSLNQSASSNVSIPSNNASNSLRIMRIHVYDKQLNPYKTAGKMMADVTGNTASRFWQDTPETNASKANLSNQHQEAQAISQLLGGQASLGLDEATGRVQLQGLIATSNQRIKDAVSKTVPTIRYGSNGTTILQATLASKADPRVSSVQMQRTMTIRNTASPNGSGEGGIPLRVVPAQLNMVTLGNPLATMAQVYFIDFQTGTTLDNLYIVTGLTHTITPGKFETQWQFGYSDGYGVFEQAVQNAKQISKLPATIPGAPG